jgi:hypothetical protein
MQCAWIKNGNDVKGNPTYRQDEVGFLVCHFQYMMANNEKPFFSAQAQQMLIIDEEKKFPTEIGGPKGISIILHHDGYLG